MMPGYRLRRVIRRRHRLLAARGVTPAEFEGRRIQIEQLISDLATSGALDEGSAEVADRLIDAWYSEYVTRLHGWFLDRRVTRQRRLAQAEQHRDRCRLDRDDAQRNLARVLASSSACEPPPSRTRLNGASSAPPAEPATAVDVTHAGREAA